MLTTYFLLGTLNGQTKDFNKTIELVGSLYARTLDAKIRYHRTFIGIIKRRVKKGR